MESIGRSASAPVTQVNSTNAPAVEDASAKNAIQRRFTIQQPQDAECLPPVVGKTEEAMKRKRERAAVDHQINPQQLPVGAPTRATKPLYMDLDVSSNQGKRPSNDDDHVVFETEYGAYFAICDGHGEVLKDRLRLQQPQPGLVFAQIVTKSMREDLPKIMKENSDIEKAFKIWANMVHQKLPRENAGTTALIGFFDKITHKLYVATIGDSELVVFRKDEDLLFPIPMSPASNWAIPEHEERVEKIYKPDDFEFFKQQTAKHRRFPPKGGVNTPTTLGDHTKTYEGKTALTHEPECTVIQLKEDDFILLGCDGLFDYVKIDEIIDTVLQKHWNDVDVNLAQLIADYALGEKGSEDNVTVMTLRVNLGTNAVELKKSLSHTAELL